MEKKFLTVDEAVEYLGLAKWTIYEYTSKKILPHYKPNGRKIYFKKEDLDNYIEKGLVMSNDQIDKTAIGKIKGS